MRTNKVKAALKAGGTAFGTMIFEFNTTGIGRIAAAAGAEFVIFDMEHTGWGIDTIRTLIASARGADIVPLVRVPATQYHLLSGPLDAGAGGLMMPMVESEEQARLIAHSTKYPPTGKRGAAFGVAHDDFGLEAGDERGEDGPRQRGRADHRADRDGGGGSRMSSGSRRSRGSMSSGSATTT